jgi:hypothetical protein
MSVRGRALCQGTLVKRKSILRRVVDVMVTARERALRPVERYAVKMCAAGHISSGLRRTADAARERALQPVERYAVKMCAAGHILSGLRRTVDVMVTARERALRPVERSDVKTCAAQAGHGKILRRTVDGVVALDPVEAFAMKTCAGDRARTVDGTGTANVCVGLRLVEAHRTRMVFCIAAANAWGAIRTVVCIAAADVWGVMSPTVVCIATANV